MRSKWKVFFAQFQYDTNRFGIHCMDSEIVCILIMLLGGFLTPPKKTEVNGQISYAEIRYSVAN